MRQISWDEMQFECMEKMAIMLNYFGKRLCYDSSFEKILCDSIYENNTYFTNSFGKDYIIAYKNEQFGSQFLLDNVIISCINYGTSFFPFLKGYLFTHPKMMVYGLVHLKECYVFARIMMESICQHSFGNIMYLHIRL